MIIYKVTNTINNKIYIGQTTQTLLCRQHGHRYKSENNPKIYFHRAINKHTWESFLWEVLCQCETQEEMNEMEHHYIKQYHSHVSEWGYNLTWGFGNTTTGYKFTDEQLKAMSINNTGSKNGMYGKTHSKETIQKWCDKRKGVGVGKNNPNSKTYLVIHPDGKQETVECLKPFCKEYNLNYVCMILVMNGKGKQHKSFTGHIVP